MADEFAKFGLSLGVCNKIFDNFFTFISIPFYTDITGIVFPKGYSFSLFCFWGVLTSLTHKKDNSETHVNFT